MNQCHTQAVEGRTLAKAANVTVATAGQRARLPPAIPRRSQAIPRRSRTRSAPPPSQLPVAGGYPPRSCSGSDPSCSGSDLSLTSLLAPPRSCSGSVYVFNPAHGCFGTRLAGHNGPCSFPATQGSRSSSLGRDY
eukprot:scpid104288/ scgid22939/ 